MAQFDVFNGDADGLCALHQLRLGAPRDSVLITGAKRDTQLLERVMAVRGDSVTVLDISLDSNRAALLRLLVLGVRVLYFDHHFSGHVPVSDLLHAHIDTRPDTCTSALVDRIVGGKHRIWAVVGAFGDNQQVLARSLAAELGLPPNQIDALRELGECLNYNAYGDRDEDLFIHPAELYRSLQPYTQPFAFIAEEPIFRTLVEGRRADLQWAADHRAIHRSPAGAVYLLGDKPAARRVRGEYGNALSNANPRQAHAVMTHRAGESALTVSVRAPLTAPSGADALCRQFQTGGGRTAAAGINRLPRQQVPAFIAAFDRAFRQH